MKDDFLTWFLFEFWDLFKEWFIDVLSKAFAIIVAIIFLPIWILPYVYWCFFVKSKENEHDESRN